MSHIEDDKLREITPWHISNTLPPNMKLANGAPFSLSQNFEQLVLEGESSLHCSSSSASSHSSSNHSPPDTPSVGTPTATLQQHCPGRGANDPKNVANGFNDPAAPMPPTFVPYPFPRSVIYRQQPTAYYHHQPPNGEVMFSIPPYVYYSSPPPPHQPPNCFNCGGVGHLGELCKEQCIEDITQRKGYQLDYTAPNKTDTSSDK